MKKSCLAIVIGICILTLAACGGTAVLLGPKQEVTAYEQKSVEINKPANIQINCDSGSIEIYSWDRPKVKFEISKKIRGVETRAELAKKLENFIVETESEKEKIVLNIRYDGKKKPQHDNSVDLKVYLPKRLVDVGVKLDTGKLRFYDDIRCSLDIKIGTANCYIGRIEGNVSFTADMGNLNIEGGEIHKKLAVKCNFGNISIKTALAEDGSYSIDTGTGNIDISLPTNSRIRIESIGTVTLNEFSDKEAPAVLKVKSGMGRITIGKYDSITYMR